MPTYALIISRLVFAGLAFLQISSRFPCYALSIQNLSVEEFHHGIASGSFAAIVDVRSVAEWQTGHIDGATLVADLALAGSTSEMTTSNASALAGCEYCPIAVYCRSGARASVAINYLAANGFMRLYNCLGVSQWTEQGYSLVNTSSITPECTVNATKSQECQDDFVQETNATMAPSATSPPSKDSDLVPIIDLTTEQFYDGVMTDFFDVIVDVRSQGEWDSGHVQGATFLINLWQADTGSDAANATALMGCEECRIVAYCGSGARAEIALEHLRANGFRRLYNGQGISQWTAAGYPLQNTTSVEPPCLQTTKGTDPFCLNKYNESSPELPEGSLSTSENSGGYDSQSLRLGFVTMTLFASLLNLMA